ncbi:MAG TPA: hypothetical protein DCP91_11220 [Eggerthellaceae bacterium]|nr:hypothetical protein [Eggerthellaceae bacterium]
MDDHLQRALEGGEYLLFDGAMGTMLQKTGLAAGELPELLCLTNPAEITAIHRAYVEAGSQVLTTNTFGANAANLGGAASVEEVFAAAVQCARDARGRYVAADIGPTGQLMSPLGDLGFSEAYELFSEQVRAAERAGADLLIIETMADLLEAAAAVLAAKESCTLPVFATMTFTAGGRTFLGTGPADAALALSLLGADAVGVNCSAGPDDLQPVVREMLGLAPCPVIVQANAGLPQVVGGKTSYDLAPSDYARSVLEMVQAGASIVGGCCGTDPDYIRAVARLMEGRRPPVREVNRDQLVPAAQAAGQGEGRDAELIAAIAAASDRAHLVQSLAEEYDI